MLGSKTAAAKYEQALRSVGELLRRCQLKDLKHRHGEGRLSEAELKRISKDLKDRGPVVNAPVIEAMGLRFTADARALLADFHHAGGIWDE